MGFEGKRMIFSEEIIKILSRKKKYELKKDRARLIGKLKNQERLTGAEFWKVYESIWQDGPKVKFSNPNNWISYQE